MTVINAWEGAVTPNGIRVVAKVTGSSTRLAVATNDALTGAVFFGPEVPDANDIVRFTATGLNVDTEYFWQIEDDGALDSAWAGQFRTLPIEGEAASYTVAFLGDAGAAGTPPEPTVLNRVSDHPAFDVVRHHQPRPVIAIQLGDLHYRDIGSGVHVSPPYDEADYLEAYDDVLTFDGTLADEAKQGRLYREIPVAVTWDNHDYGFTTGSSVDADRTLPHRAEARAAYRARVPHYPLPAGDGDAPIYQSWMIGRVLYILLDVRSEKAPNSDPDDSVKTMLGVQQREWLHDLLATSTAKALVLCSAGQWVTRPTESDTWAGFENERSTIIGWLTTYGWIDRMCVVSASMHALGIDTGTRSPGGMPAFLFAGIDAVPASQLIDTYDTGPTSVQRGQWGTLDISDTGTQIQITGTGYINSTVWQSHTFTVHVGEPPPPPPPPPGPPLIEKFEGQPFYNYIFGQARSGLITSEIPMYGVSMTRLLNSGEDFTGTFQYDMTGKRNQDLRAATESGRTFVVVERGGIPIWDGNVTSRTYQSQAKSSQVWARSIAGYPHKILMDESFIPDGYSVEAEMTEIFLELWELLQSKDETNMRVILPPPISTGVVKTVEVQPYEKKTFGDIMDEVANGIPGFDYRIITNRSGGGTYSRFLQIGYPILGDTDALSVVFDYPGSIMNYWMTESIGDSGTNIFGSGAGEGEDRIEHNVVHQDLLDAGYLRWDNDLQYPEVSTQEILDAIVRQEALNRKVPKRRYTVEAHGGVGPELGSYLPGDACTLSIEDPAHPQGERFTTRIVGWRLTPPSSEEVEKLALYFVGSDFS